MTEVEKIIAAANQVASESAADGSYAHLSIVEARLEVELEKAYVEIDRIHRMLIDKINVIAGGIIIHKKIAEQ